MGREIHPALGYVTGWGMVMDYLLNPIICTIWVSQQAHVFVPSLPYWFWVLFVAAVFSLLNIEGIRTSARINAGLAAGMGVVIVVIFVCAARLLYGMGRSNALPQRFFGTIEPKHKIP